MGFGDSITIGEGSPDNRGYRPGLEDRLAAFFGRGSVVREGIDATRSNAGADSHRRPASTARVPPTRSSCTGRTTSTSWRLQDATRPASRSTACATSCSPRAARAACPSSPRSSRPTRTAPLQPDRNQWVAAHEREDPGPGPGDERAGRRSGAAVREGSPTSTGSTPITSIRTTADTTTSPRPSSPRSSRRPRRRPCPRAAAPTLFTRPTSLQPTRTTAARPAIVGAGSRE